MYNPKIDYYLQILTDKEIKDFVAINFTEYFKSIREKQNLRKVSKSFYIFITTPGEVGKCVVSSYSDNFVHRYIIEILNLFDPPVIKNKSKELLSELKIFKVQIILVLGYKKRNDCKVFHSCAKPIASDSDIEMKHLNPHIMTKKLC